MTIEEMISSGAVKEEKGGDGKVIALTLTRGLEADEQACWNWYKDAIRRGQSETAARKDAASRSNK